MAKKSNIYRRAIKVSTYQTDKKERMTRAIIHRYRKLVNLFIRFAWNNPSASLDKETLASVPNLGMSERYKSNALKQALDILRNKMAKKCPVFKGYPILDKKFVNVEISTEGEFDLWIYLSTLESRHPIYIPARKHKRLNHWLNKGAVLANAVELHESHVIIFIEMPKEKCKPIDSGIKLGVDLGERKVLSTSEMQFIGREFQQLVEKIYRKEYGSKAWKRAIREKNNYLNWCVNQLPWEEISFLGYENLTGFNKTRKRKKQQYWSFRHVRSRLEMKSEENSVFAVYADPKNTSRMCPCCKYTAASNRKSEIFKCLNCHYTQDADYVGAINILNKALCWAGRIESPDIKGRIVNSYKLPS